MDVVVRAEPVHSVAKPGAVAVHRGRVEAVGSRRSLRTETSATVSPRRLGLPEALAQDRTGPAPISDPAHGGPSSVGVRASLLAVLRAGCSPRTAERVRPPLARRRGGAPPCRQPRRDRPGLASPSAYRSGGTGSPGAARPAPACGRGASRPARATPARSPSHAAPASASLTPAAAASAKRAAALKTRPPGRPRDARAWPPRRSP